ncbi:MAG: M20/M25/M40 family metallo-hydrolase [Chloroflexi bacterium]|nr:MAG: M20/M25/M40 family metallo-hydrolase [Chloroflexota bacterium]
MNEITRFAEKYQLAREASLQSRFESGTCGLEVEWNILDADLRPVLQVGYGPERQSFIDYLRDHYIPDWLADRNQREVYHWMTEWATRPYYSPEGAVYEARLLEGALLNVLARAGLSFGERFYIFHGNILYPVQVGPESIPGGWSLAKRRYLERCVALFGKRLATAGLHANVSLPEALLSWDFLHLPPDERGNGHLDSYKNRVYIRGARLLRPFAALFIATTASTPMRPALIGGEPVVLLTEYDSNRILTFPNPPDLDVPDLYRSHADYIRISYDLVRRGVRFGNNNWTPTRARSDVEPVARLIQATSEQLHALYQKGIYSLDERTGVEDVAREIEVENLLARIDLPMGRVEVRTDEGGHDLALDIANLALKELLLIQTYADPTFARSFVYNARDIARVRRNEEIAARDGLRAEIENPFTGRPIAMRDFLRWTLEQVRPLAEALGRWEQLAPLQAMAQGGPNTAQRLREQVRAMVGKGEQAPDGSLIVPWEVLKALAAEREEQVRREVAQIVEDYLRLGDEAPKLRGLLHGLREEARQSPVAVVSFEVEPAPAVVAVGYPDRVSEIVALAQELIRIPSVTNCPQERIEEVFRAARFIVRYLRQAGLEVRFFDRGTYPAVLAWFPGRARAPVMLAGHFDVVPPEPDDGQFEPTIHGDYLWGRGSADMKTVVATYLVWMKEMMRQPGPKPAINLLLVGNEENGEGEPYGTPHVLAELEREWGYAPELMIVGERTGERGDERMGAIHIANRGVVRFSVVARGERQHTGLGGRLPDMAAVLTAARGAIASLIEAQMTVSAPDGWQTAYRFPFINVGLPGVYNITADVGYLGVEIRPIPEDDLEGVMARIADYCKGAGLDLEVQVMEAGVACDPENPHLANLKAAVQEVTGEPPAIGRKLAGTSGRFAPEGQAVVWGQSGIGPHSRHERHYIPSIEGYYRALVALGERYKD